MASSSTTNVPLDSSYRRSPFFGKEDKFMQRTRDINGETLDPAKEPFFAISEEISVEDGALIPPESVFRLALDRGDFIFSQIDFDSYSGSSYYWEIWTDHILSSSDYVKLLKKVGLLRLVRTFRKFKIEKDNYALLLLASRWSYDTHTFIASWGEFTISLEDVSELLGIRPLGNSVFPDLEYAEEEGLVQKLNEWYSSCYSYKGLGKTAPNKSSFVQWQKYIFKDLKGATTKDVRDGVYSTELEGPGFDDPAHLAAYITALLSRFLIPGKPLDCPRKVLFRLAARLSLGARPSIAAFILGNLYYWLDQLHHDSVRSAGRRDVGNFALTPLLMGYLFERFPEFAPEPLEEVDPKVSRLGRWNGLSSRKNLAKLLDFEEYFCFRPYQNPSPFFTNKFFDEFEGVYGHNAEISHKEVAYSTIAPTLAVTQPYIVPYADDSEYRYTVYNPHRCARQFGFDQVVPKTGVELGNIESAMRLSAWLGFSRNGARERFESLDGEVVPNVFREGRNTTNWGLFWKRQCDSFVNFVRGQPVRRALEDIAAKDGTLKQQKRKNEGWRGELSSFDKSESSQVGNLPLVGGVPPRRGSLRGRRLTRREFAERNVTTNFLAISEGRKRQRVDVAESSKRHIVGLSDEEEEEEHQLQRRPRTSDLREGTRYNILMRLFLS